MDRLPCIDDFRRDLLDHEGFEEFGPEVVQRLSDEFRERRPDCAALGWDLGFPMVPVGTTHDVGACGKLLYFFHPVLDVNVHVSPSFMSEDRNGRVEGLMPTMMLPSFDFGEGRVSRPIVLVHFDPLPLDPDGWGCWYGSHEGWRWYEFGPVAGRAFKGFDPGRYLECEDRLQLMLRDLHADDQTLDVDGVAAAIQRVSTVSPDECGGNVGHYWKLFPGKETRSGCPAAAPTGALDDGGLVVNWRPGYDDAVCWVMSAEGVGGLRSAGGWAAGHGGHHHWAFTFRCCLHRRGHSL